ncbi:hypothetical protein FRC03_005749 [Tulasnella sp. 419]|nr:hypothetical protein FRC03_005749 [Tulasnella sp. 419]
MSGPKLSDFKCLVFDVYGTLIDWESGIWNGLQPLFSNVSEGDKITRADALTQFGICEAKVQDAHPSMLYSDVLRETHLLLSAHYRPGVEPDSEAAKAFSANLKNWTPFPDTVQALERLSKDYGYKLVVLSNVDHKSFANTKPLLEKGFQFDKIITAEDVGSYKPSLANFEYALKAVKEEFGIEKEQVLATAQSLYHDHAPANKLGLSSAWIARKGAFVGADESVATYTFKFDTMGDMADAVGRERV